MQRAESMAGGKEGFEEGFYLFAFSPELNPEEYLNCDLKAGVESGMQARNKNS